MNDVYTRIKLAAQTNHHLYCLVLRLTGTRSEKGFVCGTTHICIAQFCSFVTGRITSPLNWPRQFGVNNQQGPQPGEFRHCLAQVFFCNMRKLTYAGRNQETFETNYSCVEQSCQFAGVSRHNATPESNIDMTI